MEGGRRQLEAQFSKVVVDRSEVSKKRRDIFKDDKARLALPDDPEEGGIHGPLIPVPLLDPGE
jgi:hypothetical protein